MKKYLLALFIIPVLVLISQTVSAQTAQVISPNSSSIWPIGSAQTVSWSYPQTDPSERVRIEIYNPNGGAFITIVDDTANDGSVGVQVPSSISTGQSYLNLYFSGGRSLASVMFQVTASAPGAPLTLTAPGTGDVWIVGTSRDITWTSNGIPADQQMQVYRTGSNGITNWVDVGPNDGSYTVNSVPDAPGEWRYVLGTKTPVNGSLITVNGYNFTITAGDGGDDPDFNIDLPGWKPPKYAPPGCTLNEDGTTNPDPGCFPPINVSIATQEKAGGLRVHGFRSFLKAIFDDEICLGGVCRATWPTGGEGEGGGVTSIIAGDNITLGPSGANGIGNVRISSTGGGTFNSSGITNCTDPTTSKIYWDGAKLVCGTDIANTSTTGGTVTSITAGSGLSGGTITTSGTIKLDINNLTQGGAPSPNGQVAVYNGAGTGDHRKYPISSLGGGGGEANTASNLGDGFGVFQQKSGVDLQFNSLGTYDSSGISVTKLNQKIQIGIPNSGVTTAKIADGNVTSAKIAPAASNVTRSLVSVNGTVGWGAPLLSRSYSGLCSASGGLGNTNSCTIAPVGNYALCALTSIDTGDGKCEVGATASNWVINVRTDVGITACRAVCFEF